MPDKLNLKGVTNARIWAQQFFVARIARLAQDGHDIAYDEGAMLGWFANAIEAGRDAGRRSEWADLFSKAEALDLPPGDTLVIRFDDRYYLDMERVEQIIRRFKDSFPNNKIAIVIAGEARIESDPKENHGQSTENH